MRRTYRVNHHAIDLDEIDPFVCGTRIRVHVDVCHTYGDDGEDHTVEIEGTMLDAMTLAVALAENSERIAQQQLTPMTADAIESSARQLREMATEIEQAARQMPRGPQGAA